MTGAELETFLLLRLYSSDLNDCRHTLRIIKRYRKADVRYALLRDLAVSYSRPFSGNQTAGSGKHFLSLKYVPRAHREMHRRLFELRNCQFAHSSLKFHNSKVARLGNVVATSRKSVDFEGLSRSLPEIECLVVAVESNINEAAAAMQARL